MISCEAVFALCFEVSLVAQIAAARDQQLGEWALWVPSHGVDLRVSLTILSVSDIRAPSMDFYVDVILDASIVFKSPVTCRNYMSKLPFIGVSAPVGEEVAYWSSTTPTFADDAPVWFWTPTLYVRESIEIFSQNPRSPRFGAKFGGDREELCQPVDFTIMQRVLMSCGMDFKSFPLDVQQCLLSVTSFSYPQDQVRIAWKDAPLDSTTNSLRVDSDIKLSEYYLSVSTVPFVPLILNGRNTSGVTVRFVFTRSITSQLLVNILPAFLLVLVSFSAFLIPTENASSRITLTSSALLGMISLYSSSRTTAPPSSDSTVSDQWMLGCLIFELLITIECCLVEQVSSAEADLKERRSRNDLQFGRKGDIPILVRDFRCRLPNRLRTQTYKPARTAPRLNGTPSSLIPATEQLSRHDVELALLSLLTLIEGVIPWFCRPWSSETIDRRFRQFLLTVFLSYVVLFWTFHGIYASITAE